MGIITDSRHHIGRWLLLLLCRKLETFLNTMVSKAWVELRISHLQVDGQREVGEYQNQKSGHTKLTFIHIIISLEDKAEGISGNSHSYWTWKVGIIQFFTVLQNQDEFETHTSLHTFAMTALKDARKCSEIILLLGSADQIYHHHPSHWWCCNFVFFHILYLDHRQI